MKKSVGFRRDIKSAWFDSAAALRVQTPDIDLIRERLDDLLENEIPGAENRAITIQILLRIWSKPEPGYAELHLEAIDRFARVETATDRIWLHYGLSLLAYPFFRDTMAQAGLLLRQRGIITRAILKQRIIAELGQLGSLENAIAAVVYALRQWHMIEPADKRGSYAPGRLISTEDQGLEAWFLRCALLSHRVEGMPVNDLLAWPALFPFHLSLTTDDLRRHPHFELQRLGGNIDLIRSVG